MISCRKANDISQIFILVQQKLANFAPFKTRNQELDSNETFILFIFLQGRQLVILWLKKLICKDVIARPILMSPLLKKDCNLF